MDDFTSSNLKDTLVKIDTKIAEEQVKIDRGEALARLINNSDFQEVILEGYIKTEAERLFKILTDPSGQSPYTNEEIHLKLEAISHFKSYVGTDGFVGTIMSEASTAPGIILREQVYRSEVTAEYADNGE